MFQNDYLMRMILQLVESIRRSMQQNYPTREEEIESIERAIGDAMDLQPDLALNLEAQSLVSVLDLGSFNQQLGEYIVRSLYYVADLLDAEGKLSTAKLRRAQADAIAQRYEVGIAIEDLSAAEIAAFFAAETSEEGEILDSSDYELPTSAH